MKNNIKTLDVEAKKWFDKLNGNTYFSAKVTINYGMKNEKVYYIPYQYGYGNFYEYAVLKTIDKEYKKGLYSYCLDNNIILRSNIEKAKKTIVKNLDY